MQLISYVCGLGSQDDGLDFRDSIRSSLLLPERQWDVEYGVILESNVFHERIFEKVGKTSLPPTDGWRLLSLSLPVF